MMTIEEINEVVGRICANVEIVRSHGWMLLGCAVIVLGLGMLIGFYVGDKRSEERAALKEPAKAD